MGTFNLGEGAYNELLKFLNNQHYTERVGVEEDMVFLHDDHWLKDSAVISNVVGRNGMWEIYLIFAYFTNPHQLIKRIIGQFASLEKAQLSAHYMQRMAAKDQRGTLEVNVLRFGISPN
jgi:hypothetical protein